MKLNDHPLFIYCSLFIFFPVGLILLLKSSFRAWHKVFAGIISGIIFIGLLLMPAIFTTTQKDFEDFTVIYTRDVLSVGQSGGLALFNGDDYYADFEIHCENKDILEIHQNLYTAKSVGNCTLTVQFANQERTIQISVNDLSDTSTTVYITPSGTRYHSSETHAGKTSISVSEEDALMSSETPCKVCYQ